MARIVFLQLFRHVASVKQDTSHCFRLFAFATPHPSTHSEKVRGSVHVPKHRFISMSFTSGEQVVCARAVMHAASNMHTSSRQVAGRGKSRREWMGELSFMFISFVGRRGVAGARVLKWEPIVLKNCLQPYMRRSSAKSVIGSKFFFRPGTHARRAGQSSGRPKGRPGGRAHLRV